MSINRQFTPESLDKYLPVLNWIVQHAEQSPLILGYLEQIVSAASIQDKWTAFKSLGDLIVADIANFPLGPAPTPADPPALAAFENHPLVKANGAIISLLIQSLPQIVAAIGSIIALFGKASIGALEQ